jgi:hypothetical protein
MTVGVAALAGGADESGDWGGRETVRITGARGERGETYKKYLRNSFIGTWLYQARIRKIHKRENIIFRVGYHTVRICCENLELGRKVFSIGYK